MIFRILLLVALYTELSSQTPQVYHIENRSNLIKTFPYNIDLRDKDGKVVNTANLFKKSKEPIVVLFWLTTCSPCKLELKIISEKFLAWQKEKKFKLYAISIDFPNREEVFVSRVKEANWPFTAYYDFRREFSQVMPGELNGLPQVFVIDKKGKIVYHHRRFIPGDEVALFEAVKKS